MALISSVATQRGTPEAPAGAKVDVGVEVRHRRESRRRRSRGRAGRNLYRLVTYRLIQLLCST